MTDMKGPESYNLITYLWVLGLAIWGGIAGFMSKLKAGRVRAFNITEFVGEISISGLVGVCTFFLCEWAKMDQLFTAAAVGITGHMGSRGIMLLERIITHNRTFVGAKTDERSEDRN
jgi:hypothetical protein